MRGSRLYRSGRTRTAAIALLASGAAAAGWIVSSPLELHGIGALRTNGPLTMQVGWAVRDLRIEVDGRDVTGVAIRDGGMVRLDGLRLADGPHDVRVRADTVMPFGAAPRRRWQLVVDTTAPRLGTFEPHRTVRAARVHLSGRTEPGARISGRSAGGDRASTAAGTGGRYRLSFDVREGENVIRLAVRDAAGNIRRGTRRIVRDTSAPRVELLGLGRPLTSSSPAVRGRVPGEDDATATVLVDGRTATARPVPVRDGRFTARLAGLFEGEHELQVRVKDGAGNEGRTLRRVLVDSTDRLGDTVVGPGARGDDARRLLTLLRRHGGLEGGGRDAIGPAAVRAVRRFQRRKGLAVDGLVGPDVRSALLGRLPASIEVDLSDLRLTLKRGGTPTRFYPVAIGQPRHPTPTGSFRVADKQVDPVWTPPDSPWAAELDTIPAGPGNPLGTRWIGTSRAAIGIHGTYAENSIGTAASHGCIRMRIADVEQLYREVSVGTAVVIRA